MRYLLKCLKGGRGVGCLKLLSYIQDKIWNHLDINDNSIGIPYITGASNFEDGRIIINRWTDSPTTHATIDDLLLTCKGFWCRKKWYGVILKMHILLVKLWL